MPKFDNVILDLLQATAQNLKAHPLNLGGVAGTGGGAGAPPGGYIGWLPQTRVAYDQDEFASLATSVSGSLLDNLNHIRYRLNILESGASIIVIDDNSPATYYDVDTIHFSGAGVLVTDLGGGDVRVTISATGSGGGGHTIEDEGIPLTQRSKLNFVGTGVTVTDDGINNATIVTIPTSSGGTPLTVEELDGSPSVSNVNKITISGGTVTDLGSGDVLVAFSGSGRYRQYVYTTDILSDFPLSQSMNIEGILAVCSGAGGAYIFPATSGVLNSIIMYVKTPGTAGQTTIDVNKNGTTVFTNQANRPIIIYNDSDQKVEVFPNISGLVKGDILTFDIDTIASGVADLTIAPIMYPVVGYGFVTSSGLLVTELQNLE